MSGQPAAPTPTPPHGVPPIRFAMELVAWVATPWALVPVSIPLAILSVVVLIGLPTLFATPGDKKAVIVPVPGFVTILLVLLQVIAGVVSAWFAWTPLVAVLVCALAVACVVTEQRRWRWLLTGRF